MLEEGHVGWGLEDAQDLDNRIRRSKCEDPTTENGGMRASCHHSPGVRPTPRLDTRLSLELMERTGNETDSNHYEIRRIADPVWRRFLDRGWREGWPVRALFLQLMEDYGAGRISLSRPAPTRAMSASKNASRPASSNGQLSSQR